MEERKNFKKEPLSQYRQYRFTTFMLQNDGNQRHKRFGNSKGSSTHRREERLLFRMRTQTATLLPPGPYTQRKIKAMQTSSTATQDRQRWKRLACCITGSQSRLANDDGTWLCCRSLACLRGVTDGGGTPDVDADRPSLQLTFGSVDKGERKTNCQWSSVGSDDSTCRLPFCVARYSFNTPNTSFRCLLITGR